jgi:hypothetical protein
MPTSEEANEAMQHLSELQRRYENGEPGRPPGAEWVNGAFDLLERSDTYGDLDAVIAVLDAANYVVAPPPPPPSFREAMDIPEWWAEFAQFAGTVYCGENPAFIDAVRHQSVDPQVIYDYYVREGAEQQVNISSENREPLDQLFGEGGQGGDHGSFAGAYAEIVTVCDADTWPKYLKSLQQ